MNPDLSRLPAPTDWNMLPAWVTCRVITPDGTWLYCERPPTVFAADDRGGPGSPDYYESWCFNGRYKWDFGAKPICDGRRSPFPGWKDSLVYRP